MADEPRQCRFQAAHIECVCEIDLNLMLRGDNQSLHREQNAETKRSGLQAENNDAKHTYHEDHMAETLVHIVHYAQKCTAVNGPCTTGTCFQA